MFQDAGIERLSAAIVSQTVKDCARDISAGKPTDYYVRWFGSDYCYALCGFEQSFLLELAEKKAAKDERRKA